MSTTIKAATAEGVRLEHTWVAQLKGLGKAKGVDENLTFSAVVMMIQVPQVLLKDKDNSL